MLFAIDLAELYNKISCKAQRGSQHFYAKLSPEESELIRIDYQTRLYLPITGNAITQFYTKAGTHIATGYARVVIGDYGPYIEFSSDQIRHDVIMQKYPGEPSRPVKYIWKQAKDQTQVKVYEQRATVSYADYKVGMYYISPADLVTNELPILYQAFASEIDCKGRI